MGKRKGVFVPKVSPGFFLGMPRVRVRDNIIEGARRAVLAPNEMEITIDSARKATMIKRLQGLGYNVLGTSYPQKGKVVTIWFY